METVPIKISGINDLVHAIQNANQFFLDQTQRQVNTSLTLRNWVIGYYIVEYEQNGKDRAIYGQRLYKVIAENLKSKGFQSLRERNLYLCKDLYISYPQILQTVSAKTYLTDFQDDRILRTVSAKSARKKKESGLGVDANLLITRLSFSHFIELLRADTILKRTFYEVHAIKNNWGVRELQRAMNGMLFERTGLSKDKEAVLEKHRKGIGLKPEDIFRDPYMLDFLGLKEKSDYVEMDLEQAIIDHLQKFLLEMGRGFCFEARQKRITFDNPPIGIILCTDKSETLVKYATSGLAQPVFVSNYITNLPTEGEFQKIISEERRKLQQ
jgi:predicted nuclease of restriction endonuclease-like (RecB) superfamily